jgi:pullulanase/glycogen debranching enzyme
MAVLIDMVYNHSYGSSPMVRMYFANGKPTSINPWYNEEHNFQNTDAHWGYDFDHESIYTQRFIDSANSYWMNEYKVDGFRFDFTKGFTNEYKDNNDPWASNYDASRVALLKRMSDEIWARNENAIVIFEHLAENSEEKVLADYGIMLWGNLNHNFNEGTMGWLENGKSDLTWSSYKQRNWSEPNLVAYAESHDEQRLMYKNLQYGNATVAAYDLSAEGNAVERMELAAVFLLSVPGPKMIWQFGEMAYDVDINFDGRTSPKPTKWEYMDDWRKNYLYQVYSEMIKLKKNIPAFGSTDFDIDLYGAVKRVHLNHTEGDVLVMGNWDIEEAAVTPEFQSEGWWYEYFTGDSVLVEDVNAEINLEAGEYRVYSNVKLSAHDLPVSLGENQNEEHFIIYPNPAEGEFYVDIMQSEMLQGDTSIRLLNVFGQLIYEKQFSITEGRNKIQVTPPADLSEGLYILELVNQNGGLTKSVILK